MPVVRQAVGAADYLAIGDLVREYVDWLRLRHRDDPSFVSEVLDKQSYTLELANLGQIYAAPSGAAMVVEEAGRIVACGTYRALDEGVCEMKRVYVPERWRGQGLGRALCQALIVHACRAGFREMKLDTVARLSEAQGLYRSLGFRECPPYHDYPAHLIPSFVFMALALDPLH